MFITFLCDSDITFLPGLHKKIGDSTVFLYNVFWLLNLSGAGGDASFALQANLVHIRPISTFVCVK